MNSSNNNSNNSDSGFDFVYENTKPNKKISSKSRNFREIQKKEERNEKVDALIGELPKKMQKQLKSIQIPATPVKIVNISKKSKGSAASSRSYSKATAAADFSSANSEYYKAIEDAAEEQFKIKDEQKWEAYAEYLKEEYEKMQEKCQEAYTTWMHYQECTDDLEWSWATELRLKRDYDEYCEGIKRMAPEVGSVRTMQDYEADTLRKVAAKALEIKAKMIERHEMRIKREEWKREEDEKMRTRCNFGDNLKIYEAIMNAQKAAAKVWLEAQYADAEKMDKLLSMADPKFTEYVIWLEEEGYSASDRRYVSWSQEKEEKAVAADDSKYDELPLHERYTWHSESEEDEDDGSSVEDFSDY